MGGISCGILTRPSALPWLRQDGDQTVFQISFRVNLGSRPGLRSAPRARRRQAGRGEAHHAKVVRQAHWFRRCTKRQAVGASHEAKHTEAAQSETDQKLGTTK